MQVLTRIGQANLWGYAFLLAGSSCSLGAVFTNPPPLWLTFMAALLTILGVVLTFIGLFLADKAASSEHMRLNSALTSERAERELLLRRLGPRFLTDYQKEAIKTGLMLQNPQAVEVMVVISGGEEARAFAEEIADVLQKANLTVHLHRTHIITMGGNNYGVEVNISGGPGADVIAAVFSELGPDFKVHHLPPPMPGEMRISPWEIAASIVVHNKGSVV